MASMELQEMVKQASYVVALTGAGVSAESGIPTYRGSDGVWHKYDPAYYADVEYFFHDPSYYWNFFRDVRYQVLKEAEPNKAHVELARLEGLGYLKAVITQNIDGLHQQARSVKVLELHGNTRTISCVNCSRSYDLDQVRERLETELPPKCDNCGALLKPDVVMFGEALPQNTLHQAGEHSRSCDLFLAIGSSLTVQPAASLPAVAKQAGARLVVINPEVTQLDYMADLVLRDTASEALSGIADG